MNIRTIVSKVQLFHSCAIVTRTGHLSLPAGRSEAIIEGLTASAQADSLRLAFPAGIHMEDIHIEENQDQTAADALAREIDRIDHRIQSLETEQELLKQNSDYSSRSDMRPEEVHASLALLPDRFDQIFQQIQDLQLQKKNLLQQYQEQQEQDRRSLVCVTLLSDVAIDGPCTMTYRESRAHWIPLYELRFAGTEEPLQIRQRARLVQTTPEDWTPEELVLCTGDPSLSQEIPDLGPQYISLNPPYAARYSAPSPYGNAQMTSAPSNARYSKASQDVTAELPELFEAETALADEQAQDTITSYTLSGARTIPQGSTGCLADLKTYQIPASYQITAIPALSVTAWLTARIKGSDWPLQDIDAALYLHDVYGGQIHIDPDTTEEDFLLSLGRDERVRVHREKTLDRRQDQLLKKRSVRHLSYEIRILSQLPKPVSLEIQDRLPVSMHETVLVEPLELSGAEVQKETGKLTWKATLKPGQTLVRTLTYDLYWPRGQRIYLQEDVAPQWPQWTSSGSTQICPQCGSLLHDDAKFCPRCGNPII